MPILVQEAFEESFPDVKSRRQHFAPKYTCICLRFASKNSNGLQLKLKSHAKFAGKNSVSRFTDAKRPLGCVGAPWIGGFVYVGCEMSQRPGRDLTAPTVTGILTTGKP